MITEKGDIGEDLHPAHSEPFFYESAYQFVDRPDSMSIDECDRYVKSASRRVIVSPEHGSVVAWTRQYCKYVSGTRVFSWLPEHGTLIGHFSFRFSWPMLKVIQVAAYFV